MINAIYKYFMLGFTYKADLAKEHIKNIKDKKEEKVAAYELGAKLGKNEELKVEELSRIVELLQITTSEKMQTKKFLYDVNHLKEIIDVITVILQYRKLNVRVSETLEEDLKDYWQLYINRIVQQIIYDLKLLKEEKTKIIVIKDAKTHMLKFISIKDRLLDVKFSYLVLLKNYFKEEEQMRITLQKIVDKPKDMDDIFNKVKDIIDNISIKEITNR
ncbi:MAG TPA: hypothetical protein PKY25_00155 [Bacilli bacterium]|nr:hypothetical protein [Bacilli bacterium]